MQSEFYTYFQLGIQHIADIKAYDHILFVIALCAVYPLTEWRKVLILVTAFTLGHSLTLGLSALDIIHFKQKVVEFLIPVTILITALINLSNPSQIGEYKKYKYFLPMVFGFIHGMGFSSYFKSLLGKEESVIKPLFAFNLGIEVGQLGIIAIIAVIVGIIVHLMKIPHRNWVISISVLVALMALYLMWETKFW